MKSKTIQNSDGTYSYWCDCEPHLIRKCTPQGKTIEVQTLADFAEDTLIMAKAEFEDSK